MAEAEWEINGFRFLPHFLSDTTDGVSLCFRRNITVKSTKRSFLPAGAIKFPAFCPKRSDV